MRTSLLVADPEGSAAVPRVVMDRLDEVEWIFETSGTAALARLRVSWPALAVVNLQLPDMCGSELIDRIRKGRPGLPVVVTSDHASRLCERYARSLGVIAYLPKPVSADELERVLTSSVQEVGGFAERAV